MRWVFIISMVMLVATCGQKGPLTLPKKDSMGPASISQAPAELDHVGRRN